MEPVAWSAVMIGPTVDGPGAARLRTEFHLDEGHGDVAAARWHVSAHGVVESYLAGAPASADVLTPGFSSFEWRLRYRTYDVASALRSAAPAGEAVVLGLEVGHGWYRGRLGWTNERAVYGDRAGAIAQLEITYADGHAQRVVTDGSWTAGPSDVLVDDLYDGQTIDARLRSDAWLRSGFDDPAWTPVVELADVGPLGADALRRPAGGAAGGARTRRGVDLTEWWHAGRLRTEPGRLGQAHHSGGGRVDDHRPARRGDRARRARHPPVALRGAPPTRSSAAAAPMSSNRP